MYVQIYSHMKKGNCSVLLEETVLTYYWIGFILADGHIHNSIRLKVALGLKDKEHLLKLKHFLKVENHIDYPNHSEFSVMDSAILRKFCKKFKLEQNKTIKACDISSVHSNLLKALFIGFIDGDGYIGKQYKRKDCCLFIKCHSAWLENLNIFSQEFLGKKSAYLNKAGYANLHIGNHLVLKDLKQFIINNQLPVLERKWNKINL